MLDFLFGLAVAITVIGYVVYRFLKAIVRDYSKKRGW